MWFEKLMGFEEKSPDQVRNNILVEGGFLKSKVNNAKYQIGQLEVPTLDLLRSKVEELDAFSSRLEISEIVYDVQRLHCDISNKNALFQAASQFNLLEMVGPDIVPEQGISRYEYDYTQGPACAIACGAGTIYRNYLVPISGQVGQTRFKQIDCLDEIGIALDNVTNAYWKMQNGYALPSQEGLLKLNKKLANISFQEREIVKGKLRIGLQWDAQVTISLDKQLVSQAYCSALPVAYSHIDFYYWEHFARLILEATYEATLYAGLLNYHRTGCNKVYLTLVGGGAFGNEMNWILDSIEKAVTKFYKTPLDIKIVSYGSSNSEVCEFINKLK